jgi:DNA-binding transcriptional MerR regulator
MTVVMTTIGAIASVVCALVALTARRRDRERLHGLAVRLARHTESARSGCHLTVEQLAAEVGMSVRNIRNHHARGLLPAPEVRARVGYYSSEHVARIRLILDLQADGYNLTDIERLLAGQNLPSPSAQRRNLPVPKIPSWAMRLMASEDAERYTQEWGAHLYQLIEEGELRQARRDRRRLVLAAITLAVALRVRRALGRAH